MIELKSLQFCSLVFGMIRNLCSGSLFLPVEVISAMLCCSLCYCNMSRAIVTLLFQNIYMYSVCILLFFYCCVYLVPQVTYAVNVWWL